MNCQERGGLVNAYLDGELDLLRTVEFEQHMESCAECRAMFDEYQSLRQSVQTHAVYFEAPEGLEPRIRARLRLDDASEGKGWIPETFAWRRPLASIAGIAALVIFTVISVELLRRSSSTEVLAQQVVASHIRSLMANHLTDVASSDQHTVKPWFSGKLDFAPTVKDLASSGFPLTGGRLDYLDGRSVAALLYKHRQHVINLFVWPTAGSDARPKKLTIKGYNLIHWTRSHMTYWAVSDLNALELDDFARDQQK